MDQGSCRPVIGIVDDDEGFRQALDSLVRSLGYRSAPFASAEEFLASDRIHETDCLLVDYHMPGSGGLHLQRLLARMNRHTPVIMLSGRAEDIRVAALQAGAIAVITKPFSPSVVIDAIRLALRSSQPQRS